MARFKINGVAYPAPSSASYKLADLSSDESGRDLSGKMHKDVIAKKRTLDCSWTTLTFSEAHTLASACKDNIVMSVTFPDIANGGDTTMQCYTGDFDAEYYNWKLGLCQNIKCSFIEV